LYLRYPRAEQESRQRDRKQNSSKSLNKSSDTKLQGLEEGSRSKRKAKKNKLSFQYKMLDSHVNGLQGDLKELTTDSDQENID
jgi:hypothetical protein